MSDVELSSVKPSRVFQSVLEQLENAILSGDLKPGDKLPKERKLIQDLNISRPTLREALRVLEQKGLIEIRLGVKGGAYIKKIGVQQATEGLSMLFKQRKVSIRCLYEFREGTEGAVAALATERASQKDIDRLDACLKEAKKALSQDPFDYVKYYEKESQLHVMLAEFSGNIIYEWVLSAVQTKLHSYVHFLPKSLDELKALVQEWDLIVHAMRRKEVSRVRNLVSAHVCRYNPYTGEDESMTSDILIDL